jgi:hypothetical protein
MADRIVSISEGFERFTDSGILLPTLGHDEGDGTWSRAVASHMRFWNGSQWVRWDGTVTGGTGGSGGAVTVADGADIAEGSTSDVAWVSGNGSLIAISKAEFGKLEAIRALLAGTLSVNVGLTDAQLRATPVPVSNASLPLPAGAATEATLAAANTNLGTDGAAPPAITGTGIRGWLRAIYEKLTGSIAVTGTFWQATQPVSLAANTPDVTDRSGRLLGHVTVDSAPTTAVTVASVPTHGVTVADGSDVAQGTTTDLSSAGTVIGLLKAVKAALTGTLAVSGTFFQATQPVSLAANTPDVIDRMARLLGAVNLSQVAGTAVAAKALPTNADGQVAIPVYVNAQQYATYDVAARNVVTGALTANTAKAIFSLEHALASVKTVRIRRIMIHMLQTTALAGLIDVEITRGTAASSAGTAVTPQPRKLTDPAAEVVAKSLPTIVAATVADNIPAGGFATTTTLYSPPALVYDWQESGEMKPYMLVAGALQSLVINVISTVAHNLTLTISVDLTEE